MIILVLFKTLINNIKYFLFIIDIIYTMNEKILIAIGIILAMIIIANIIEGFDSLDTKWTSWNSDTSTTGTSTSTSTTGTTLGTSQMVTLYVDCGFSGQSNQLGVGSYDVNQLGIPDNSLSSLKIPSGLQVQIFESQGFTGRSITLTSDQSCLLNQTSNGLNFNDVASSLIISQVSMPSSASTSLSGTCDPIACENIIDGYIQKGWAYTSSSFSQCNGCPVVSFPNKLPSTIQPATNTSIPSTPVNPSSSTSFPSPSPSELNPSDYSLYGPWISGNSPNGIPVTHIYNGHDHTIFLTQDPPLTFIIVKKDGSTKSYYYNALTDFNSTPKSSWISVPQGNYMLKNNNS